MKIPSEILKKVKLLEISSRKIVNNLFVGEYQTRFRGQGMTFADFREYVPGDDVRSISWALTARAGRPYVKQFEEEREMTLMLVVDVSGSTDFGSVKQFKGEVIVWLSALLAFAAAHSKDQVGLLLVSDCIELYVPPKKGRSHVQRILRDLLFFKPKSAKTNLSVALKRLQGFLTKKTSVFIFSDFIDQNYENSLRRLAAKHDVIACVVTDPMEMKLPSLGVVDIQDAETGEMMTVDTSDSFVQRRFQQEVLKLKEQRSKALKKAKVDIIEVSTHGDFTKPLLDFFRRGKNK